LEQKSSRKKKADQKRKSFPNETAILKNTNNTEKPSHGRKQNTTAFLLAWVILGYIMLRSYMGKKNKYNFLHFDFRPHKVFIFLISIIVCPF